MEELADWVAERREAGEAFVIAGDFNRRLAIPGDWAWALLTEDAPTLSLPTAGRISRCDERYPEFIDHLVFDTGLRLSMVSGSFEEGEHSDPHPDHCPVSARFRVAPAFVTVPFLVAASNTPPFGFVRVFNHSGEAGTVEAAAIDDTGARFGPVSLALDADAVGTFSSSDLEDGAAHRGLSAGVGEASGPEERLAELLLVPCADDPASRVAVAVRALAQHALLAVEEASARPRCAQPQVRHRALADGLLGATAQRSPHEKKPAAPKGRLRAELDDDIASQADPGARRFLPEILIQIKKPHALHVPPRHRFA